MKRGHEASAGDEGSNLRGRKAKKLRATKETEDRTQDGPASRRDWTAKEDARLLAEVGSVKYCNWRMVCKKLNKGAKGPRRSAVECKERWNSLMAAQQGLEPWTPSEELVLLYQTRVSLSNPAILRMLLPRRDNPLLHLKDLLLQVARRARQTDPEPSLAPKTLSDPILDPSPSSSSSPSPSKTPMKNEGGEAGPEAEARAGAGIGEDARAELAFASAPAPVPISESLPDLLMGPGPNAGVGLRPGAGPGVATTPGSGHGVSQDASVSVNANGGPTLSLLQDLVCLEMLMEAMRGDGGCIEAQEVVQQSCVELRHCHSLLEMGSRQLHLSKALAQDTLSEYLDIALEALQNAIYADYQGTEGLDELIHIRDIPQNPGPDRAAAYNFDGNLSTFLMRNMIQHDQ